MDYKVLRDIPNHIALQDTVSLPQWPEFMLHDPVCEENWVKMFDYFQDYQFSLSYDDEIIGIGNCLPFYWDKSIDELPDEGWDWVFEKAISDHEKGLKPNMLNGLQIVVNGKWQGKGISTMVLKEMSTIGAEKGFNKVTIPVRPSLKSKYPLTSIDNYINWKRDDGLPFDPWLRVHARFGGKIIKPCHEAMRIPGRIQEWEKWTGMTFPESGEYVVNGALNPIVISLEEDLGVYIEPNIWVLHEIK